MNIHLQEELSESTFDCVAVFKFDFKWDLCPLTMFWTDHVWFFEWKEIIYSDFSNFTWKTWACYIFVKTMTLSLLYRLKGNGKLYISLCHTMIVHIFCLQASSTILKTQIFSTQWLMTFIIELALFHKFIFKITFFSL